MNKEIHATRTCSACGQKKPLLAFLELNQQEGHRYGDICATCRGQGKGLKAKNEVDAADTSGGTTRLQIDNKARMQLEENKAESFKKTGEEALQDKLKKEHKADEKENKAELQQELDRREREEQSKQPDQAQKKNPATLKKEQISSGVRAAQTQQFYQEKAQTGQAAFEQERGQQLGNKESDISPEYVARLVSSTGSSAERLFGNLLGQFLRNDKQVRAASGKKEVKKEGESLAVDFARNNFKKR